MSVEFDSVPGNDELKQLLARELSDGTLSHAYIIEGERGVGKRALADAVAKAALCQGGGERPCGVCASCRHFEAKSHPDVTVVGRDGKATIGVDVIRDMRADTHIIPSESERKVYIIEDADTMTAAAQNALLLSFEEPPPYVLYLLLCTDSKSLLETIRSRAACLHMRPCTESELGEYLTRKYGNRAKRVRENDALWREMLVGAGGNPGTAAELLDEKALSTYVERKKSTLALVTSMMSGGTDAVTTVTSSAMRKLKRDDAAQILDDGERAVRDMIMAKKTDSFDLCFFPTVNDARDAGSAFTSRTLCMTAAELRASRDELDANMSVPTALLSLAIRIKNI